MKNLQNELRKAGNALRQALFEALEQDVKSGAYASRVRNFERLHDLWRSQNGLPALIRDGKGGVFEPIAHIKSNEPPRGEQGP